MMSSFISNKNFNCTLVSAYMVGELGESRCKRGYQPILSPSGCNHARNDLSISKWNVPDANSDSSVRLPYCYIGGSGNANHNSKGDSGTNGRVSKLICEKSRKFHT